LAALVLAALPGTAWAGCRLALMLALDISSSVDAQEDALQRQGLAAALATPAVVDAIVSVPAQGVALSVIEWSGRVQQTMLLGWTMLDTRADVARAAARISASRRSHDTFATAIGRMLKFADMRFGDAPRCDHRVLDVSGDGVHNDGPEPREAYAGGVLRGVTVNGLAIVVTEPAVDHAHPGNVAAHYRAEVIRGPGAFVIQADGFEDFQRAMRAKLLRELSVHVGQASPAAHPRLPQ
jgi:hypothetical protein